MRINCKWYQDNVLNKEDVFVKFTDSVMTSNSKDDIKSEEDIRKDLESEVLFMLDELDGIEYDVVL